METWGWGTGLPDVGGERPVGLAPTLRPPARALADSHGPGAIGAEGAPWTPWARRRRAPLEGAGARLVPLAMIALASLLVGGCAAGVRPPTMTLRDAYVTYLIPKDPQLANLHGSRTPRLSLPAYERPGEDETVTGLATTLSSDGRLVIDRFTRSPKKGRRAGVEIRVQQETLDRGDRYVVTLRPESVRTYGGLPFFDPPRPPFTAEELYRHLSSARFRYQMDVDSAQAPEQLCASIRRRTLRVATPSGEDVPASGGRARSWFALQYGGVEVRFSVDAVPSAIGTRATFSLIVPSYLTAPHTVDLAQILAGLREQLVRLANEETE